MNQRAQSKAEELRAAQRPFATAQVVRAEAPTSAKPGAAAVITPEGGIFGWIGGGCAQPTVIEQAQAALRDGQPRLIRISPQSGPAVPGVAQFSMTCFSGGTLDIFIQPELPRLRLVLLGRSPTAHSLACLGAAMGYTVDVFAPGAPREDFPDARQVHDALDLRGFDFGPTNAVVVASQGEYDEEALEAALATPVPYVAFVASGKKWQSVRAFLEGRGVAAARLDAVKAPAGLDLHAVEAEEVALSILAEIVMRLRSGALALPESAPQARPQAPAQALDPICGMTVEIQSARGHSHHAGRDYYFCCPGCKKTFDKDPARYLKAG